MIKKFLGVFVGFCVLLPALVIAQALPVTGKRQEITLAVLAFRPKLLTEAQWTPLVDYLNQKFPSKHFVLRALNYPELEAAAAKGEIDLVLTQPAHYILLSYHNKLSSPLVTLVNVERSVPLPTFGGVIAVLATRQDLRSLADLKGKKIATASVESFGGYLMQEYEMQQAGIPVPRSDQLLETGMPHDRAIGSVLSGKADAAFVRSGLLEEMLAEGKLKDGQLRVINRQSLPPFPFALSTRLYPEWPIAAFPHIDEAFANSIAAVLLKLPHEGAVAKQIGIHGFDVPADYHQVVALLQALRQPPFDTAPTFTMRDIRQKYRWQIVIGSLLTALVLLLLVLLWRANRRLLELKNLAEEGDKRLRQFSAQVPGMIYQYHLRTDGSSHYPYASEGANALFGVSPEALKENAEHLFATLHPDDVTAYHAMKRHSAEIMQEWKGEYRVVLADGSVHWRESNAWPQRLEDGSILWHGFVADIDERKSAEKQNMLLVAAFEASANAMVITDLDGRIEWVNPAFCALTGYTRDELVSGNPRILKSGMHDAEFYAAMWRTLLRGQVWHGEIINRKKDGSLSDEELIITPVRDDTGKIRHYIGIKQDISLRKRLEEELRLQASTDMLTKLPNRRSFFDHAETELARIRRNKAGAAALIMLDIDHFKRVNDTYGHAVGDLVLQHLAATISATLRRSDHCGRIGGEEFVLLLPETTVEQGVLLAERLRAKMEASAIVVEGATIFYTASFGLAMMSGDDATVDMALARADEAMYRAKQSGRNRVEVV